MTVHVEETWIRYYTTEIKEQSKMDCKEGKDIILENEISENFP